MRTATPRVSECNHGEHIELRVVLLITHNFSMKYDTDISGADFCTQFSHLNPSITPGNHQWRGSSPLFSKIGYR
jgi:hypothetical protein